MLIDLARPVEVGVIVAAFAVGAAALLWAQAAPRRLSLERRRARRRVGVQFGVAAFFVLGAFVADPYLFDLDGALRAALLVVGLGWAVSGVVALVRYGVAGARSGRPPEPGRTP